MKILQAFFPFIAFALVERAFGAANGLVAGAIVALVMLARDVLITREAPKLLDIGTLALFGSMAIYALIAEPDWGIIGVRLRVDAGLLLIVLSSLALRRPFTEQYAREQVAPELWNTTAFRRVNVVISAGWALAFAIMVTVEFVMLKWPVIPARIGVWAIIAALAGGVWFTGWYPKQAHQAAS